MVNAGHFANASTIKYYYKDSEIKHCISKTTNATATVYNLCLFSKVDILSEKAEYEHEKGISEYNCSPHALFG